MAALNSNKVDTVVVPTMDNSGIRTVLLNSNPATIQTDREIADRIYIEPVDPESVIEISAIQSNYMGFGSGHNISRTGININNRS